jgi:hypothetical protein
MSNRYEHMNVPILEELQASGDRKIILVILQDALHIAQNPHCRGVHFCPKHARLALSTHVDPAQCALTTRHRACAVAPYHHLYLLSQR